MGLLTRLLVPRKVRRVAHPVRSVKRAATPKSVKRARRALHPVSNAKYSVERSLNTKKRRRSRAPVFRHAGCSVAHRTQAAADKCHNGRPSPARPPKPRPAAAPRPASTHTEPRASAPKQPATTTKPVAATTKPATVPPQRAQQVRPQSVAAITPEYLQEKIALGETLNRGVEAVLAACGASNIKRQGNRIEAIDAYGQPCAVFPTGFPCLHGGVSYFADSAPGARVTIVSAADFDTQARRVAAERAVTLLTSIELEALAEKAGLGASS